MYEIYFTPNPDEQSPVGLLEVSVAGEEPTHHNVEYADLILRAIEASKIEDPQARVMEAVYRGTGIPRELVDHMEATIRAVDVADPLVYHLYELWNHDATAAPFTEQEVDHLGYVLQADFRGAINYLTPEGLFADPKTTGRLPGIQDATEPLELEAHEEDIAAQLGTERYVYHAELVWRPGEDDVLRPVLLSGRLHTALGHVVMGDAFEHIVTVLAHDPRDFLHD